MNTIKSLIVVCAMLCSATVSAQFTTGGKSVGASTDETADYNQFGVAYTNETFSYDFPKGYDDDDTYNIGTNGFSLRYLHGFSVSKSLPMFVETGLNLNFNFGSVDYYNDDSTAKYQFAALAVPVNFAYRFKVNESVTIKPYLGLNVKFNLMGRMKWEFEDDEDTDYDEEDDSTTWGSLYSTKDMGDKDAVWNRFQLGWHIGAEAQFNRFYIGLNYGTDFIKAYSYKKYKINSATLNIGVGVYF